MFGTNTVRNIGVTIPTNFICGRTMDWKLSTLRSLGDNYCINTTSDDRKNVHIT